MRNRKEEEYFRIPTSGGVEGGIKGSEARLFSSLEGYG